MSVLVTGGAGFIGSAVVHALADAGMRPVILDDLSAGRREVVDGFPLYHADIADGAALDRIHAEHEITTVIHCAARKSVPESVAKPLWYYQENVGKTLRLLDHLRRNGSSRLVFSSSASVYADADGRGIPEEAPLGGVSPYARTKLMVEQILTDIGALGEIETLSLRYFNPIGADPKLRTGPSQGFSETALGALIAAHRTGTQFRLMGTDWATVDGTAVRDYVHLWDVAEAHVAAVRRLEERGPANAVLNVGSGRGTSLRELLAAFERVTGEPVTMVEAGRRAGDLAGGYAVVDRARDVLGWTPRLGLEDGIRDTLAWATRP